MKKETYTFLLIIIGFAPLPAQVEDKISFSIGGDLVSSYIWRGAYQAGASVQPSMAFNVSNFSLSSWASMDIANTGFKEVDFSASYNTYGLDITITDYWWVGEGVKDYYMYEAHRTGHLFEAALAYTLPIETCPLSFYWSTMFAGADYFKEEGEKRSYSSFFELSYPFHIKNFSIHCSLGATPWEGLYAKDFAITSISLKAEKTIKITEAFSIPVFGQLITNPQKEDTFFVFGIRL